MKIQVMYYYSLTMINRSFVHFFMLLTEYIFYLKKKL